MEVYNGFDMFPRVNRCCTCNQFTINSMLNILSSFQVRVQTLNLYFKMGTQLFGDVPVLEKQ